ncbi:MAG: NRDE family protein [Desulfobacterales bacterium]
MCLILFAYKDHPDYSMIVAANRDEYYQRPTLALDFWEDAPDILAGRDLEAKGTWLGMSRTGRIAALTNFRGAAPPLTDPPSRGELIRDFLAGKTSPEDYLQRVRAMGHQYNGFNLLAGEGNALCHYSNRGSGVSDFKPGIYGLSNDTLGSQWPKIVKGKAGFARMISGETPLSVEALFELLEDRSFPPDDALPPDDPGRDMARIVSPLFVEGQHYGTRSSSVILIKKTGEVTFAERTFVHHEEGSVEQEIRKFEFVVQ